MPTNSVYENLFHGINEIPLFTYGMLSMTTVVLAYFTMYDIESASGEEGESTDADTDTNTEKSIDKDKMEGTEGEEAEEETEEKLEGEESTEETESTETSVKETPTESEPTSSKPLEEKKQPIESSQSVSDKPMEVLQATTSSPVSELSNLTESISKSLTPTSATSSSSASAVNKGTSATPQPAVAVPLAEAIPTKASVGGHKKRKTKRSIPLHDSKKKTTRGKRQKKK